MKLIVWATPARSREYIQDEANEGRLPLAWLTFGYLNGHGWGFLHPWAQQAIFPSKGRWGSDVDPASIHDAFLILRYWPAWGSHCHPNHEHPIEGRYWRAIVWRRRWGRRPRLAMVDYDCISVDDEVHPLNVVHHYWPGGNWKGPIE